jgi:hyperosmotically inducible protein
MQKLFITATIVATSLWLAGCSPKTTDQGAPPTADLSVTNNTGTATNTSPDGSLSVNTNAARDVDNTGINKRDRNEDALTPGDQGASAEDREITRKIRRAITQNDQLSITAKNIKIITASGKVTLRGPVNSQAERDLIAAVAQQMAGPAALDNQLEVKQPTATKEEPK